MAENKKAIIVYADWLELFEQLTDEEAGKLIKHFFRYVNDQNPVAPDRITELSFIPIKQSLKRDLTKWEGIKEERSYNGRIGNIKRWHPDLYLQIIENQITLEKAEEIANNRKTSPPDTESRPAINNVANVAVSVNDSVSVKDKVIKKESIEERKLKFAHALKPFVDSYGKELIREFYDYWTEHGEKDKKFRQEKQTSFDISKRLATWKKRENNFKNNTNGKSIIKHEQFSELTKSFRQSDTNI